AASVKHYYNLWGGSLKGKRVIVQGWGNVAAAAAFYCTQEGALVVGIIDRAGGIVDEDGLDFSAIKKLFLERNGMQLRSDKMISFEEVNERIWDMKADVFLPCAASRLVTDDQMKRMINAGLSVVSCGANVPFADAQIFYGPIAEYADEHLSLIPDFIANCGMARVFAYLMSNGDVDMTDRGIFEDTSETIEQALKQIHAMHKSKTGITKAAFEIALKKLV
ncbi:MAG: amino acid dehydrogenase, partial [Flavobacteriales bacterium]